MKIVLDTNVLINGFKDEYSYEKRIIDAVIAGEIEAYANKQTLQENRLISSQLIDNDEYKNQLNDLFTQINWVVNRRQIRVVRDPEDNKILESAVEAEAEYLVTSDNDLLRLEEHGNVKIVNPAQFWVKYKDEGMDLWKQLTNFVRTK
ncbi:MAG TPA: putative toxin-antitoxin system toxin component, PIN family [Candidatus Limnocylindria bacterium]|nr:putative toxin-antitoxin system toxin component, PIN family [Candidatus Limnocylindria bacterium]